MVGIRVRRGGEVLVSARSSYRVSATVCVLSGLTGMVLTDLRIINALTFLTVAISLASGVLSRYHRRLATREED